MYLVVSEAESSEIKPAGTNPFLVEFFNLTTNNQSSSLVFSVYELDLNYL